ncbi:MAG: GNAT family N-acetyltransferase [Deltaproteobacteria bacterium]|nr:GNAT family N-acetyltransferase [Deltaproteobacteria bacterium]
MAVEYRLLLPEENKHANNFYNAFYQKKRTLEQWRWEFISPARKLGEPLPFAAAFDGEKLVGTQAIIPIRMIDQKGVFWAAKSEETLVDPAYRGQNLFAKMYELLFAYARQKGLYAIWGFTPARRAFEKIGFAIPLQTRQLFLPFSSHYLPAILEKPYAWPLGVLALIGSRIIHLKGILRRLLRGNFPDHHDGLEIIYSPEPPAEAGTICERFVHTWGGTTIYRDPEYLAWRFYGNPYLRPLCLVAKQKDHIQGFLFFCMTPDRMGYIVDLLAIPVGNNLPINSAIDDVYRVVSALIKESVRRLESMGALGVRIWSVGGHPFDRLVRQELKRQGFLFVSKGHDMIFQLVSGLPERQGLSMIKNWYITRAFTEGTIS